MNINLILSLMLLFYLLKVSINSFVLTFVYLKKEDVTLSQNDISFDILTNEEKSDFCSIVQSIPNFISLDESNHSIELDFLKAVGEVEIIISQNGAVIYSSLDNIIQVSQVTK